MVGVRQRGCLTALIRSGIDSDPCSRSDLGVGEFAKRPSRVGRTMSDNVQRSRDAATVKSRNHRLPIRVR